MKERKQWTFLLDCLTQYWRVTGCQKSEEEVYEYQFSGTMCRAGDVQNCSNADDDQ